MSIISDEVRARQTALIDSWLIDLRVSGKAEATIETYEPPVRRAHRELLYGLAGSTTDELRAWIWAPGHAPSTRKVYRAAVISFFTWAYAQQHVDYNSAALLPTVSVPENQPRPAPQEVLARLLAEARDPFRRWIAMAAAMGLRCVEISRLDREHITQERSWIQGKGGKNCYLPTHPAVWDVVCDLPSGPIARRPDGSRATRRQVYMRANDHIRRILGRDGVTMHMFRHWHGTNVFEASDWNIMVAKASLRHTSVAHTQRYLAIAETAVVAAQRAIPLPI